MKKIVLSAEQIAGLFIGLLGTVVAIRWIFMSQTIGALIPGSAKMGINSPLLFIAAGYGCLVGLHRERLGRLAKLAWTLCVGLLLVLPTLVLAQHVFDISLGIDFVRVPTPPTEALPHPGRMALNTCLGFLFAGVALALIGRRQRGRVGNWVLSACAAVVAIIGFGAMAGYFLKLEGLYRIAASNAMVPPTAVGMSVLAMGLWLMRSALIDRQRRKEVDNGERITFRAIAVVTLVALSAGAAGFAAMRDSYEQSISENMLLTATTSAASLNNTLETSLWFTRTFASRPSVRDPMSRLDVDRNDAAARAHLLRTAQGFMGAGFSAFRFHSVDGELLAQSGELVHGKVTSRQPLDGNGQADLLLWRGSYLLYTETDVRLEDRVIGRMIAEQRLPIFDKLLADIHAASASSDILLCNLDQDAAFCGPTRFYTSPFRIAMYKPDGKVNLPINHALLGRSGVAVAKDLRGVPVFAAYTPLGKFGLAVVVKSNVETLYAPLRYKANALIIALVALVVLGASMLLIQVRPLLAQLVREQRRTRVILENSNDAFIALGVDGRITDWNTEAERTFGWSAAEAIGRSLSELIIPPSQRAAHDAGFERFRKTGTGPVINTRIEVSAICRDGREIPIELSVAGFHNGEGYVANAFIRDITERHRLAGEIAARTLELELERDRAQAANRAKGEFVANMSHELRTPMNAVLGMTYLLTHTDLKAEQKKYLEMIRTSGQSLLGIMNDILDFSKVEAGRMELTESRFHLGDVLGAVATIMSVNAGDKDLELAIGVEPDVPQVLAGDALRLQQILVNLVGNAIKFTEHGEVSLLVALLERSGSQVKLQIQVRDTGIGMDAEQQARLFSPFTQGDSSTTRRFGGTGLGLTISRHLTELMGGSIEVDSEEGRGSEFRIKLPLRVEAEQGDARRPGAALGKLRLLIVDDNQTSRAYLAKTIATWQWDADSVDSGAAAIEMIKDALAQGRHYDVVLLDWQMPGMDGLSTMQALRALLPPGRLPITLMVNAYGRGKLMGTAAAADVDAILSKPVTGSSLFDTLHEVLVQRARTSKVALYQAPPATQQLGGVRLLLVEDNELNQAVARGILERVGAQVDVVSNGREAVVRLTADPALWDLVLMDIQMPLMDGYEATRAIRATLGLTLPVLAMTAGVTQAERAACIEAGMNDLIAKPIEVDDMLARIARHLGQPRAAAPASAPVPAPASAPAPAAELPVLKLAPLVAIARGNPVHLAAVANLVRKMAGQADEQFAEALAHWREGRAEQAAKLLHALRGGVGSVGAKRFAAAALTLELAIKGEQPGDAGLLFELAQRELTAAMDEARAWLATQPG